MSMDVISYGVANKAASEQKKTRNTTLGVGVEGQTHSLKERIDLAEKYIQGVVKMADNVIIQDAVNIMKANAKLNMVAKSKRYKMANMIFEDFLDSSGIDATKSIGYTLDSTLGTISVSGEKAIIIAKPEATDVIPKKAILTAEESGIVYSGNIIPQFKGDTYNNPYGVSNDGTIIISDGYFPSWSAEPYHISDGDYKSYWVSKGGTASTKGWIGYKFKQGKIIKKYAISAHNGTGNNAPSCGPGVWTFEGSNDNGITWTILGSETKSKWNYGERAEFAVNNDTAYTSYRINVTSATTYMLIVAEIEMMEKRNAEGYNALYYISRDNNQTWQSIKLDTLYYFPEGINAEKSISIKVEIPSGIQLLNYGLTWS